MSTSVTLQVQDERFTLQGTRLIDPGFTTVMHWLGPGDESFIPDVQKDTLVDISSCKIAEKTTTPPGYLTEVCCPRRAVLGSGQSSVAFTFLPCAK